MHLILNILSYTAPSTSYHPPVTTRNTFLILSFTDHHHPHITLHMSLSATLTPYSVHQHYPFYCFCDICPPYWSICTSQSSMQLSPYLIVLHTTTSTRHHHPHTTILHISPSSPITSNYTTSTPKYLHVTQCTKLNLVHWPIYTMSPSTLPYGYIPLPSTMLHQHSMNVILPHLNLTNLNTATCTLNQLQHCPVDVSYSPLWAVLTL